MYDVKIEGVQGLAEKIAELESIEGGNIDLSAYAKTEDVNKSIEEVKNTIPTIDLTGYVQTTDLPTIPKLETQSDSKATTIAGLVTDFNTLLTKLKTAGLMA